MCTTHVSAIHVLYLHFYTYNTCVVYTLVLHMWNMCITGDLHMYYGWSTHVLRVYQLLV